MSLGRVEAENARLMFYALNSPSGLNVGWTKAQDKFLHRERGEGRRKTESEGEKEPREERRREGEREWVSIDFRYFHIYVHSSITHKWQKARTCQQLNGHIICRVGVSYVYPYIHDVNIYVYNRIVIIFSFKQEDTHVSMHLIFGTGSPVRPTCS